jgi:glycosyltransferase involved in cell wall biosynthesis
MPSNTKKIAVNTRGLAQPITGVQRYTREIVKQLDDKIIAYAPKRPCANITGHLWEQFVLPRQLQGELLWSPANTGPISYPKQVLTIHDVAPLENPNWFNFRFRSWYKFMWRHLATDVLKIITVSKFSANRIMHHLNIPSNKIEVVYCGVSHDEFFPRTRADLEKITPQLKLPKNVRYILSLSSLAPSKNTVSVIKAWGRVVEHLPSDVFLLMVGGQSSIAPKLALNELPPRVIFLGYVSDNYLPILYSNSMAFIYPSCYEGFGLPIIEAMASGTPTIVSNLCSIPEVVGDAAIMINPYSIDDIATAIKQIIFDNSLKAEYISKGLEHSKLFSWGSTTNQIYTILNNLL